MSRELRTKKEKNNTSHQQFQRLKKQVTTLKKERFLLTQRLEKHMGIFHARIRPLQEKLQQVMKKQIVVLFPYVKEKRLSKDQKKALKELVLCVFSSAFPRLEDGLNMENELSDIYKKLAGHSWEEKAQKEFLTVKEMLRKTMQENGINIDLDSIKMGGSQKEILENIDSFFSEHAETFREHKSQQTQSLPEPRKEISTLYKRLVKILHPDLEQDIEAKKIKEELMKQVTVAYEKEDLHTLLSMECNLLSEEVQLYTETNYQTYIQALKEQVAKLKEEIELCVSHPQYHDLQSLNGYYWKTGEKNLTSIEKALHEIIERETMIMAHIHEIETIEALIEQYMMESLLLKLSRSSF